MRQALGTEIKGFYVFCSQCCVPMFRKYIEQCLLNNRYIVENLLNERMSVRTGKEKTVHVLCAVTLEVAGRDGCREGDSHPSDTSRGGFTEEVVLWMCEHFPDEARERSVPGRN